MGRSANWGDCQVCAVTDEGELDMAAFSRLVNTRTKVISVTGLSNVLGTIIPLEQVSDRARDVGALLVVDGGAKRTAFTDGRGQTTCRLYRLLRS